MNSARLYNREDVGCYADGALGHQHVRSRLAELVSSCDAEVATALTGPMSDDAWEEDAALALLQEHTGDGLTWELHEGDLMLRAEDEES